MAIATIFMALPGKAETPESGKFYRLTNYYTGKVMSANASFTAASALGADDSDKRQMWLLTLKDDATGYYLRNAATGAYLTSPRATNTPWPIVQAAAPVDATMLMTITEESPAGDSTQGLFTMRLRDYNTTYAYAHHQTSDNAIVCWTKSSSLASYWRIEKVPLSDEESAALMDAMNRTSDELFRTADYQTYLDNLFTDKACTELKNPSVYMLSDDYKALPAALRAMADKVAAGDWAETNGVWAKEHSDEGWDDDTANWNDKYARKYRLQLYEPYSEGSIAASLAGIQAYTNMNNPTGILADAGDLVYVMVNDDVPEGATLYLGAVPDDQMYNGATSGVPLKKGLNAVMCGADNSHFFVYYTVTTATRPAGASRYQPVAERNLQNYKPIKIHIEGGRLNGFFNYHGDSLYGNDTDEDYRYTIKRASHVMYDLLGDYVILHLHLNDTPQYPGETTLYPGVRSTLNPTLNPGTNYTYDPVEVMKAWDNMCFAERMLMGIMSDADIALPVNKGMYTSIIGDNSPVEGYVTDPGFHYNEYFNNRMMGISQQGSLFMNATAWRSAYNVTTINVILPLFPNGDIWGPAHEYGHINQSPMNIAGTTEESNNIFSNVALYYAPKGTTSRCDYPSNGLKNFLAGNTFLLNGTWGTTRMFWQLWSYYHAAQKNTKFYPRLYELLRRYPISKTTVAGGTHNPKNDMLHFAKMCCVAAGEDLTNFFEAWGFFFPFEMLIDDYSQYHAVLTQDDIDVVKAEIAAMNLPVNNQIILIDDRVDSSRPSHSEFDKTKCGDLGGINSFIKGANPSGGYGYMVDGTTVKVSREDDASEGVGFLIFDKDGNLVAFSNSYQFEVTADIARQLLDGTLSVQAVGSTGNMSEVTNTVLDGSVDEKRALIAQMVSNYTAVIAYVDATETKVGWYYPEACETMMKYLADAQQMLDVIDNHPELNTYTGEEMTTLYKAMTDEYFNVTGNPQARIQIMEGCSYRLVNHRQSTCALSYSGTNCVPVVMTGGSVAPFSQQWIFEPSATLSGGYYIRNVESDTYVGAPASPVPLTAAATQSFSLLEMKQGIFALAADGAAGNCIHQTNSTSGNIIKYGSGDTGSQWTITRVFKADYLEKRAQLLELISEAAMHLEDAGETEYAGPYVMDYATHCNDNGVIYSNAPYTKAGDGSFTSWSVLFDTLADGSPDLSTYFRSDYSGNDSADKLNHYIRFRTPLEGESFRYLTFSYTNLDVSGSTWNMPRSFQIDGSENASEWTTLYSTTSAKYGQAVTVTTPEITAPKGTKYIRFMVNGSAKTYGGHPIFGLSDVKIVNRTNEPTCTPSDIYPEVTSKSMEDVASAILDGKEGAASADSSAEHLQNLYDDLAAKDSNLASLMGLVTSIEDIHTDGMPSDASVVFYNLQGLRVTEPGHGIFIRMENGKASKVAIP